MPILTSNLGYPRIGEDRELKFALEGYWSGKRSAQDLESTAADIRAKNWSAQQEAGIDLIPSNDFSLYDHVLDISCLVGAIPDRFNHPKDTTVSLDTYFALARGTSTPEGICCATHSAVTGVVAQQLHKWFDTNYHYLVPELRKDQVFTYASDKPLDEFTEALEQDILTKPVLLGPISYLLLAQCKGEEFDRLDLLPSLLDVYGELVQALHQLGAEWIQLDEPALALDLTAAQKKAIRTAYDRICNDASDTKILLGTYFGELGENLDIALSLPVDAIHLDAVEAKKEVQYAAEKEHNKILSVGVVNGRNIWKNDLESSLSLLSHVRSHVGDDRLIISPSSSLVHVPYDLRAEKNLEPELVNRLAFARQKLDEVGILARALNNDQEALDAVAQEKKRISDFYMGAWGTMVGYRHKEEIAAFPRRTPFTERKKIQQEKLQLPLLPTTTIGSFPQTKDIRVARAAHNKGLLSNEEYDIFVKKEVEDSISKQEEAGLDVLVHGEPERNDMVQFFAEKLHGIATTEKGWVQSFGSRYVRPPIIHDAVWRTEPLTVDLAQYAQSLTNKPVKGMLTGPLTIYHWSYGEECIDAHETCSQIALAIREEVEALENAGIRIIQIDEPALREGLPLRAANQQDYFDWATACFRLASTGAKDSTQIHTHTCYGDVRDILPVLRDLDVDVISIEAARSRLAFLDTLNADKLPCDIGPGIWDIHSPRVPSTKELTELIRQARLNIPDDQLWINPDCGLKTRSPDEVWEALWHLVQATKIVRSSLNQ